MSRKMPIFYSALLLTGVNLLLRLVSTSFQVFISGRLGASGVGLLHLVMSVGSMSMTAGMAGVRTASMYLTAEELGRKRPGNVTWVLRSCMKYSLACSSIVGVILFCFAPQLASLWIGNMETLDAIRLFAGCLPVVCLSGCMTGYFTAANRIGTLAAIEVLEQLAYMAVTMTALVLWAGTDPGRSCFAVVLGSGVGSLLTLSALLFLRFLEKAPKNRKIPTFHRLLDTAIPLALADDLKTGINTVENLMVPKRLALFPGSGTPLAAFGMVCGMVFPVLMFPAAILFALAELLIPELARCAATQSQKRIHYLSRRSLRIALLYGCFCGGILFLLSQELCVSLYENAEAGQSLRLYAFLAPMLYCDAITDAMTKGLGQQKTAVRYNILTAVLDVIGLYLLLPRYGMIGYFISFLISHFINFVLSLNLLIRTTGISISPLLPVLALGAAAASAFAAATIAHPVIRILAFLGLFGSFLVLLGVVSMEDIHWLRGLVRRH